MSAAKKYTHIFALKSNVRMKKSFTFDILEGNLLGDEAFIAKCYGIDFGINIECKTKQ